MLYTTEPVRDLGWWARTAFSWLVLMAQNPGWSDGVRAWAWWALVVLPVAVLVYLRDRWPLALAVVTLLLTLTVAEIPIAIGMAAVASRARRWLVVLGYALAGAGALMVPWAKRVPSGITATGPTTEGDWLIVVHLVALILLPALVGALRRANREALQQRLGFEAEQREIAASQAVAEERTRIAQEMHDVLGHKLSLITVQAGALEVNPAAGAEVVAQQSALIRTTARQALDELREILGVLGDSGGGQLHPQPGLAETLDLIAHNQSSGLRVELRNELPDDVTLPAKTGAALHRIVQEGLTNLARHSPGAAATLHLGATADGDLAIELVNRPASRPGQPGSGRGLPGLRERVRALGGTLDAGPTAEGGYRLAALLPLHNGSEERPHA